MIERIFGLKKAGTTLQRELSGGLATFMTMAYIIFVQPAVLGAAGMDPGAVMVATCLATAFATFLMAFLANYPIAQAPAMGHNFFFAYTVVLTLRYTWQQALGAIFISGLLFIALSFVGLRERLVNSIPATLKNGIAAGIGLLIAVVGLEWAGIVVHNPGTLVGMGKLSSPPVLLSLLGLTVMAILLTLGARSAILAGILTTLIVGLMTGMVHYQGIIGPVPSLAPTLFKLDIVNALRPDMLSIIFVFFFLTMFDTVGTLIGVSEEAGFLKADGSLPRARQALLSDAIGTTSGALLGTSTVTSYIESAVGVSAGARTGLANVVTGLMFLLAIFFAPLVKMIGGGIKVGDGLVLYPVIAPALIIVGCFMLKNISHVNWNDFSEAVPAFLTIILMPFTFSITEGIAFGFISYTVLKAVQGKIREVPLLVSGFAILFLIRYIFLTA